MKAANIPGTFGAASLFALVLIAAPVRGAALETEEIVYEIEDAADTRSTGAAERFVAQPFGNIAPSRNPIASFGPFHMIAPDRAELIGSIESGAPAQFAALLRAFPGLKQIDMVDCPGTGDDEANLALARMIRRHGVATYVPDGGSVRSGGVELFLAGIRRSAAPTAEFAVHSWRDEDGYEADDFSADDPVHRDYIAFYREMGLNDERARAFYAMTNSAPHDAALYLRPQDIAKYIPLN